MQGSTIKDILEEESFQKRIKTLKIVIVAIVICPFLYIAIGILIAKSRALQAAAPVSGHVLWLLYIISGLMALLGLFLPEKRVSRGSLQALDQGPGRKATDREKAGSYVTAFFKTTILRAAIFESIGIYGLVGCLMTGDTIILIALNFFAMLFIMMHYPAQERFLHFVERLGKR